MAPAESSEHTDSCLDLVQHHGHARSPRGLDRSGTRHRGVLSVQFTLPVDSKTVALYHLFFFVSNFFFGVPHGLFF